MHKLAQEHLRTKLLPFWEKLKDEKTAAFMDIWILT